MASWELKVCVLCGCIRWRAEEGDDLGAEATGLGDKMRLQVGCSGPERLYLSTTTPRTLVEAEVLDSETVECADKTIVLDMKSNTQGKFVKLTEVG